MSKSKVKCIITGETLGVRPEIFAKRVEKAGSEDELHRTYVSREAKQLLREGKTVEEIRKQFNATNLDPVPDDVMSKLTDTSKKKPSGKAKAAKVAQAETEKEVEASTSVDPDVAEFMNTGATALQTA